MNRIKQCREKSNLSQKYVAVALGVAAPSVSNWESGKTKPTMENYINLAKLFCVSVEYLLGVDEDASAVSNSINQEKSEINPKHLDSRLVELISDLTPIETEKTISYIEGMKSCREQKNPVHEDHAPGR